MNAAAPSPAEEFAQARARLAAQFLSDGRVHSYMAGHTAAADRAVLQTARSAGLPDGIAIVAVGGYGRAELFPFSDLDLLILVPEGAEIGEAAERFTSGLWSLGLTVGESVRTVAECVENGRADITILTAMLENRFIGGSRPLYEAFRKALASSIDSLTYCRAKALEQEQRWAKHDNSPYELEPDIKESPGGLRDLHIVTWMAEAAGFGSSWGELERNGLITGEEARALTQAKHRLCELRMHLHLAAGRHRDRLSFDMQSQLAATLGCSDTQARSASEALMQDYYRAAKSVILLNTLLRAAIGERLLGSARQSVTRRFDKVFVLRGATLDITDESAFAGDRTSLLRAFLLLGKTEATGFSLRLMRSIWHGRRRIDADFRRDPRCKEIFLAILQQKRGVLHSLRPMALWGVLGLFLPVFNRITGMLQHDLFHVYTVDQHTLRCVSNLRRFVHSEYAHEFPLCTQIMGNLADNWLVTLAGLFHDIGKGRGGRHEEIGAKEVRAFARSFGLSRTDTDFVAFLVREHLTMSQVAQKQDISDPEVIEKFCEVVGNARRLDALYLLTVADIRATGPKVWTAWKAQLLEDLYRSALQRLAGTRTNRKAALDNRRETAMRLVRVARIRPQARDELWNELDLSYFMRQTPEQIAWHTQMLAGHVSDREPRVCARPAFVGDDIELFVYVPDQKDLFARVVSYFERKSLSVIDARIQTTHHGWALDTFIVSDRSQAPDLFDLLTEIEEELAAALRKAGPLMPALHGRSSRRSRSFPIQPNIFIEAAASGDASWLLIVTCADRLGLLSSIARTLAARDVNLSAAKILTVGERAEDVFQISSPALVSESFRVQIENELSEAVL